MDASRPKPPVSVRIHRWGPCYRVMVLTAEKVDDIEICLSAKPEPDESRIRGDRAGIFVIPTPLRLFIFGRTVLGGEKSEWIRGERMPRLQ